MSDVIPLKDHPTEDGLSEFVDGDTLGLEHGGTGATDADSARANLEVPSSTDLADVALQVQDNVTDINGLATDVLSLNTEVTNLDVQVRNHTHDGVYLTNADVNTLIQQAIDNLEITGGNMSEVSDIVRLPAFLVRYDRLRTASSDHSGSKHFFDRLDVPYYINQYTTNRQVVANVTGSGFFTGFMLPCLEDSNGNNRQVTVYLTVDGTEVSETFTYSNSSYDKFRLFIGAATNLNISNSKDNDDYATSSRRPQKIGVPIKGSGDGDDKTDKVNIPHTTMFLNYVDMPRINFNTSLKVEYQLNQNDVLENSSYRNRAVAMYMLGDF